MNERLHGLDKHVTALEKLSCVQLATSSYDAFLAKFDAIVQYLDRLVPVRIDDQRTTTQHDALASTVAMTLSSPSPLSMVVSPVSLTERLLNTSTHTDNYRSIRIKSFVDR